MKWVSGSKKSQESNVFLSLPCVNFIPIYLLYEHKMATSDSHSRLHVSPFSSRRNDWSHLFQHSQPSLKIYPGWKSWVNISKPKPTIVVRGLDWSNLWHFPPLSWGASWFPTTTLIIKRKLRAVRKGKGRNTCLQDNQYMSPFPSLLSRHHREDSLLPRQKVSVSLGGLRGHLAPQKLLKIAIRSRVILRRKEQRICLPRGIVCVLVISQSLSVINNH